MSCKGTGRRFLIPCPRRISFQGLNESAIYRTDNADRKSVVNHGSRAASSRYRGMLKVRRHLGESRSKVWSEAKIPLAPELAPFRAQRIERRGTCDNPNATIPTSSHVFHNCSQSFDSLFLPSILLRCTHDRESLFTRWPSLRERSSCDPPLVSSPHFAPIFFPRGIRFSSRGWEEGRKKKKERHLGVYVRDMLYRTTRHAPRLDPVADSP